MKYILITGRVSSRAHFFEKIGKQGQRTMVPTYFAELGCSDTGSSYHFTVVRDSSYVVFGHQTYRFGDRGECPSHRIGSPYRGFADTTPRNGWCIRIYEPGFKKSNGTANRCLLQGTDSICREHILLHAGPCGSAGCMSVAGGRPAFLKFRKAVERILDPEEELFVFVEPRPEEHHNRHLSR